VETGNGTKTPVLSLSPLWRKKKISRRLIEIILNRVHLDHQDHLDHLAILINIIIVIVIAERI